MRVEVLLFGIEAANAGQNRLIVELPDNDTTCHRLRAAMAEADPRLRATQSVFRLAVNQRFVDDQHRINPQDEIAVIGPVSGG